MDLGRDSRLIVHKERGLSRETGRHHEIHDGSIPPKAQPLDIGLAWLEDDG